MKKILYLLILALLTSFCNSTSKVNLEEYDIDPQTGQKKKKYEDTSDPYKVLRD